MAYIDWVMKGPSVTNCDCNWGCPCWFNALPTYGDCRTVALDLKFGSRHGPMHIMHFGTNGPMDEGSRIN